MKIGLQHLALPLRNKSGRLLVGGILMSLFIMSFGCSPARKAIREPLKTEGSAFLYSQLQNNKPVFHTLSARASLDIESQQTDLSMKAQIRVQKDSLIWMSFSPLLGIEAVRILLTPDSVKFLDRINKNYFCGDYSFFHEFYQVDFDYDMIESILLGVDFRCYDSGEMKAGIDNLLYTLSTANRRKIKRFVRTHSDSERVLLQDVWLDPQTFRIRKLKLKEANRESRKLGAEYEMFESFPNGDVIPQQINLLIQAEQDLKLKIKLNKIELDESLSFPFGIPSSYEPINFDGD